MKSLLSLKNLKRPTTVCTLADSVGLTGQFKLSELMLSLEEAAKAAELAARPRPFYLICHRCNDLASAEKAIKLGANAIECDIQFTNEAYEFSVNHDFASLDEPLKGVITATTGQTVQTGQAIDSVPLKEYLDGLAKLLKVHTQVAMVIFDLKDADANRARRLRDLIRKHLTDVVPVNIIMSQADYANRDFFVPIKDGMREREGYAIDQDNEPLRVSKFFEDQEVVNQCYGNGIFVAGGGEDVPPSVLLAVGMKWALRKIRWVYVWTLRAQSSMRNYLRMGVDGIMVNHEDVANLKRIVENEMKGFVRLAQREDNPFAPPVHPAYVLAVTTASRTHAGTDANLTFELRGSAGKVATTINTEPTGLFEKGHTNLVTLIGKDVGTIQELTLTQDGSGNAPDWFVDTVRVQKSGAEGAFTFKFNQEILPNQPVRRKPA